MENNNFYRDPNDCTRRGIVLLDYDFCVTDPNLTLTEADGATITVSLDQLCTYLEKHQSILYEIIDRELEKRKPVDSFEPKRNSNVNPIFNPILDAISDGCGNTFSDADPGL